MKCYKIHIYIDLETSKEVAVCIPFDAFHWKQGAASPTVGISGKCSYMRQSGLSQGRIMTWYKPSSVSFCMAVFGCSLGDWVSQQVVTVLSLSCWYSLGGGKVCCEDRGGPHLRAERSWTLKWEGTMDSFAILFKCSGLCFFSTVRLLVGSGSSQPASL